MIDMEVGTDDEIDCLRREPSRSEVGEERAVLVIEFRDQRTGF